jgi:hypothetical protein
MYLSISIIIWLNKKNMILINKVIEHNRVYNMCSKIKYHDLHISLDFFLISYLVIVNDFF